jgi:TonB family protein
MFALVRMIVGVVIPCLVAAVALYMLVADAILARSSVVACIVVTFVALAILGAWVRTRPCKPPPRPMPSVGSGPPEGLWRLDQRSLRRRYPFAQFIRKQEGWVILKLNLGADGLVETATIDDASPDGAFERAALKMTRSLQFERLSSDAPLTVRLPIKWVYMEGEMPDWAKTPDPKPDPPVDAAQQV